MRAHSFLSTVRVKHQIEGREAGDISNGGGGRIPPSPPRLARMQVCPHHSRNRLYTIISTPSLWPLRNPSGTNPISASSFTAPLNAGDVYRVTLAAILRNAGYKFVNVFTGAEALEAYEGASFDAVILDIRLTDADGIELLRKFRESDSVLGTLMLSGAATLEDAVETLNQGQTHSCSNPWSRLSSCTGSGR